MLSNAEKSTEGHTPKNDVNGTLALGNPGTSKSAGERDRKRLALRARNLEIWHKGPQEPSGSLDSSMKKNTGFIKRVRLGLGVDAKAQLLKECSVLNLDKYVEELTQAIPEGLTKCTLAKDCLAAAEVRGAWVVREFFRERLTEASLVVNGIDHFGAACSFRASDVCTSSHSGSRKFACSSEP